MPVSVVHLLVTLPVDLLLVLLMVVLVFPQLCITLAVVTAPTQQTAGLEVMVICEQVVVVVEQVILLVQTVV
jgi:hypothetical protein